MPTILLIRDGWRAIGEDGVVTRWREIPRLSAIAVGWPVVIIQGVTGE
ncbi:hypothetical protein [Prochlorothrix hollandica]|nr:hypothetical protein [Prochlorothrix hollandica]